MKIQRYKHELGVSYALGATLIYELLRCAPELAERVYISSSLKESEGMEKLIGDCKSLGIPVETNDKAFNILSPKGNCFAIAEFRKRPGKLENGDHIVLANPSDAGNMGTILRTATGFGFGDIAVIKPAVDCFDPRTVRASMGAIFHARVEYFDSIEDYIARFPDNRRLAFMLTAKSSLPDADKSGPFSLIFGNEATGLPAHYADICEGVIIKHSDGIDSLNLPTAAGIAMYEFTKDRWNR